MAGLAAGDATAVARWSRRPAGSTAYATVRADALGVWTENGRTVAFYLEHDTGTENLTVLTVSEAHEQLHQAIGAGTDLLRCLGVEPDKRLQTSHVTTRASWVAAAVLIRAAGIEPNAVKVWPGPTA